jgi:hypothetical protein
LGLLRRLEIELTGDFAFGRCGLVCHSRRGQKQQRRTGYGEIASLHRRSLFEDVQ